MSTGDASTSLFVIIQLMFCCWATHAASAYMKQSMAFLAKYVCICVCHRVFFIFACLSDMLKVPQRYAWLFAAEDANTNLHTAERCDASNLYHNQGATR